MKSIEKQLNLSLASSILLIFIIFWWISVFTIHHLTENYILTRLEHDTVSIEKHLKTATDGSLSLEMEAIAPIYTQPLSGHYFVLKTANQTLASPSLTDFNLQLKTTDQTVMDYEAPGPREDSILVRRSQSQTHPGLILYVAEDHTPIQKALSIFDWIIGIFALITLTLLYWSQRRLLRKGFKQLDPIHQALDALKQGQNFQLNPADYPIEVAELIGNLNQALTNASAQLQKSRQSNANLAHSLKTPLNLIYQLLDDPALQQAPQLKSTLNEQAHKIHARIESELKSARLAADSLSMQNFSLKDDLKDLIDSLSQLYPEVQFSLDLEQQTQLPIEKEDGYELLGNLLDNAAKFSQGHVWLRFQTHPANTLVCWIEDNGSGVAPQDIESIQQRGQRLDETIPGHGIGLSIVKNIVEAYHLELDFSASPKGGLAVRITFQ